jgi:hypothetical protein
MLLNAETPAVPRALVIVILAILSGCKQPSLDEPPPDWVKVDARYFEFFAPRDLESVPVEGIDSFVGEYVGNSMVLGFDYGAYSDPLNHESSKQFVANEEFIDGKRAKVVSYYNPGSGHRFDYVIAVHFPDTGERGTKLTVYITCKTPEDSEAAKTILETIRFK